MTPGRDTTEADQAIAWTIIAACRWCGVQKAVTVLAGAGVGQPEVDDDEVSGLFDACSSCHLTEWGPITFLGSEALATLRRVRG